MLKIRQLTFSLVLFINILLGFLLVFENRIELPVVLQFAGRLHPMVLHFPLALLFVGIILDWLQNNRKERAGAANDLTEIIFSFYALGASLTALFGLFLYKEGSYQGDEINLHKWYGAATASLSIFILWFRPWLQRIPYVISIALSLVVLIITGHLGAEVTHGEGFLSEPFKKNQPANRLSITNPDSAFVYQDVIQPIFNEKCINCHNPNKAKNDLLLTDFQNVMKGGKNERNVVPGKASESLLFKYILLPMSDTLHMPPDGKTQLDPEEIKLIGWWINTGAESNLQYLNTVKVDSIDEIMAKKFHPREGIELLDIDFADPDLIKELNTPYRTIQQISVTSPYIAVFLGTKSDFTENDLNELKSIGDQVTSLDLGNSSLNDVDLKSLRLFPHLRKLHLQNTAIGDQAIGELSELKYLELLNLSGTRITSKSLEQLKLLKELKMLFIYNTTIDQSALDAFKKSNPAIEVFSTKLDLSDSLYNARLTLPSAKIDSTFFHEKAIVELKLSRGKVSYYYTLDGSVPDKNSTRYIKPFEVTNSCNLQVIATMAGWKDSPVAKFQFIKIGIRPDQYIFTSKPDKDLSALSDSVLFDGKSGSEDFYDRAYLNFVQRDLRLEANFIKPQLIREISISYLLNPESGIVAPKSVEIWGGITKDQQKRLGVLTIAQPAADQSGKRTANLVFNSTQVRFMKIVIKNPGVLIPGILNKSPMKPSILIDEIALD
jgi:uncharacterized membrane protein